MKKIPCLLFLMLLFLSCNKSSPAHFNDVSIIFFTGGTEDYYFSKAIYNGARAAQNDLGPSVEYVWSNWDVNKMLLQFKEAIEKKPDGIAMMGHPGTESLKALIDEALRKGVIVTTLNVDLPELEKKYVQNGFGYAGQDIYASGKNLAAASIRKFNLKPGDRVLLTGVKKIPIRGERTYGAEDTFKEAGLIVDYIEDTPDDLELLKQNIIEYLKNNKDVAFILDDIEPYFTSQVLKEGGYKSDEILLAGFDLSQETFQALSEGYIHLILDQQPYLQGYLPVLQICLTKKYGFGGLHIDTGSGFFDKTNLGIAKQLISLSK